MQFSLNLKFVGFNMGRFRQWFSSHCLQEKVVHLKVLGKILLYAKLSLEAPPAKYACRL